MNKPEQTLSVAIIGTGPAGLMAAHVVANHGYSVKCFDKKPSAGRKLLIAGSSGLNITHDCTHEQFLKIYDSPAYFWNHILNLFSKEKWIEFIHQLNVDTFLGTSRRYFVKDMKAALLLKNWTDELKKMGVEFFFDHELIDFHCSENKISLNFEKKQYLANAVCFAFGGGSWEPSENPMRWIRMLNQNKLNFIPFKAENTGFKVDWNEAFLKEAEGKPLKNIKFTSSKGSIAGELMITKYGIEGTPVYTNGEVGTILLDLMPDLSEAELIKKLTLPKLESENLSGIRRIKKYLKLSPAAQALLFHFTSQEEKSDLQQLCKKIKNFPITLTEQQPIEEAISSSGGLDLNELTENLMLKKIPGIFCAGEMLNWTAPTGGYLIQACVSQGYVAGLGIVEYLKNHFKN